MQKIKLTEPIKIDGILVSELTLRRPKVRDRLAVERMGNSDAEKEVALIANLASISREAVEEFDLADYNKIQEVLQGFLSQQKS
ncbi:phage tail assembly protein [Wolbachia endosymbiont of Delia radicum]|uniref:phage tail assembly protein n=1 Tax=Wolbachia endosymbiont of Delia radicum TaxID=502352 RepID=UPI001F46E30C|nr:phage tail assembly protein [Wolbachia endosymbiont of Delia radicum]UJQ20359.1 phage tail assembly protein [Wolbachia endosymbiont of Delia radicum]